GTYSTISLNINTGAYNFTLSPIPTIAIVGEAAGGWPDSPNYPAIDLNQMTTLDGINYRINFVPLIVGAIKFRANNNWTTSWGGLSFPTGPQTGNEASNINVTTAGNYRAVFNRNTGVYSFDFPSIAIVGEAVGGWPGDPGNPGPLDIHQLVTTDGETYTINNLVVTTALPNGGAKFRQDNDWTINWGNNTFPTATSSNGNNILTVAGTYNVTFTRTTGAYNFTNILSVQDNIKNNLKIYPNPTSTNWNISNTDVIDSIELFDISGKTIEILTPKTNTFVIEGSKLSKGFYFVKIKSGLDTKIEKIIKN
ncbi:MAG: T9SS type A sorting domain-containing protein, partial [Candidatus Paceibacterota bacterium]